MSLDIGPAADFAEGQLRLVQAGRRQVGVVRWSETLYAVNNHCPHQGGPLCLGVISGRLDSDRPGSLRLDPLSPVLACPWHGWEFDLKTGVALADPTMRVRTYHVGEVHGRVLLSVDQSLPEPSPESGRPNQSASIGAA